MADKIQVEYDAKIKRLEKELRQVERRFKGVDSSVDKSKKGVQDFEKQTNSFGQTAKRVGGIIAGAFAVGQIVDAGKQLVQTTADFQKAMSNVQALTGANERQFQSLSDQAKELGRTTVFSAREAADGMGFLAQAGFKTNEIMTALPGTLELAAAGNLELAQAADIASNVLSGFGLQAEEIGRVNDILAKTATSTNTNVQQMGEAFRAVAPIAESAGISIEETSAAIGSLGDAGIQGSRAGTQLRGVIASLSDMTPKAQQAIEGLGLSVEDVDIESKGLVTVLGNLNDAGFDTQDAMRIFGREASSAATVIAGVADETNNFAGELENAAGTAEDIAQQKLDNLAGSFKLLSSATESFAITLGEDMAPGIRNAVQGFTDLIQSTTEWLALDDVEKIKQEQQELNTLVTRIQSASRGTEDRSKLIDELNKKYPQFLGNLSDEAATNRVLSERLSEANNQFIKKIALAEAEEKFKETLEEQAGAVREVSSAQIEGNKILSEYRDQIVNSAQSTERGRAQFAMLRDTFRLGETKDFQEQLLVLTNQMGLSFHESSLLTESLLKQKEAMEDAKEEAGNLKNASSEQREEFEAQKRAITTFLGLNEDRIGLENSVQDETKQTTEYTKDNTDAIENNTKAKKENKKQNQLNLNTLAGQEKLLSNLNTALKNTNINDIERQRNLQLQITQTKERIEQMKRVLGLTKEQAEAQQNLQPPTIEETEGIIESEEHEVAAFSRRLEREAKKRQEAKKTAQTILTTQVNQLQAVAGAESKFAQFSKSLAFTSLLVEQGKAIASGISSASTLPFPANLAAIASVIATISTTFLQAKQFVSGASVPNAPDLGSALGSFSESPGFAEGTKYVERNGAPRGVDTINARLTEGEAIVPVKQNRKYNGLVSGIIDDDIKQIGKWAMGQPQLSAILADKEKERSKEIKLPSNRKLEKAIKNNKTVSLESDTIKELARQLGHNDRRYGW